MVITHVIDTLDPAAGGPPRVAARLAAAQAALGHTVHVVSRRPEEARLQVTEKAVREVPGMAAVSLQPLPRECVSRLGRWRADPASLLGAAGAAEVFHLHGVWDGVLRACAEWAGGRGAAHVVRPAGMLDVWSMKQSRLKKRIALALGWRRMLDRSLFIHALNRDEAELMSPLRLRAPVEVIPNGIFLEEVGRLPPGGSFRAAHPELGAEPFVLFLSRLHFKKGLDVLADAFAAALRRQPTARLVVAGPDEGAEQEFRAQVRRLGIAERVHLVGPLYGADKLAALVDASLFCLPSRQEGFSVAITEALACGAPVVISTECHFPEVAEEGAGRVVPLDAAAVAAAMAELLADPAAARGMGERGRAMVLSRYTWPEIARLTVERCRDRLAARGRG